MPNDNIQSSDKHPRFVELARSTFGALRELVEVVFEAGCDAYEKTAPYSPNPGTRFSSEFLSRPDGESMGNKYLNAARVQAFGPVGRTD